MQAIGHRHRKTKRWEAAVWAVLLGTAHLAEAAPDPQPGIRPLTALVVPAGSALLAAVKESSSWR